METTRGLKIERMEGKTELAREVELEIAERLVKEFSGEVSKTGLVLSIMSVGDFQEWIEEQRRKEGRRSRCG